MKLKKKFSTVLVSVIFTYLIVFYYIFTCAGKYQVPMEKIFLNRINNISFLFDIFLIFLVVYLIIDFYLEHSKRICEVLYKRRYIFAVLILTILVVFKISGSSIGIWKDFLPNISNNGVLLGVDRTERSDEWGTNIPLLFSQFFGNKIMPYYGDIFRGKETDMFVVYGQPVRDISIIFRPFHWGYLFLGLDRGLSFYWCARLITLFMITFEFFMLLTKKNKHLSVTGALLVTLSPLVSWWFISNGFVEMLIAGQLYLIILNKYMLTSSYKIRFLLMLGLVICAMMYILALYPAWQVPLFYFFLAFAICIILKNKNNFKFSLTKDGVIAGCFIIILLVSVLSIFFKSYDAIMSVINTVYPGKRIWSGGGNFENLFRYVNNIFLPLKNKNAIDNVCEMGSFYSFAPLGFLLSMYFLFKKKNKDKVLIALSIVYVFLGICCLFEIPEILMKITLLAYSSNRTLNIIELIDLFLIIYSMSLMKEKYKFGKIIIISVCLAITVNIFSIYFNREYIESWMIIPMFGILLTSFIFILRNDRKRLLFLCVIITFFSGVLVNPVRTGTAVITDNELIQKIKEIDAANDGKWIADLCDYPMINIPTMACVPTVNSTHVYPNLDLWYALDSKKEYEEIYNRYSHPELEIVNDSTNFVLLSGDRFVVNLNVNDIEKTDAKYVLTTRELLEFNNENVEFKLIYQIERYLIYEILYH